MRQLRNAKQITSRETISLDKYLHEISKESLLTVEDEVDLAKRIREGDAGALERLTKANLRFVVSVAKQYQNQGLTLPDLINEGNLGLIKAAQRFDETRGFKFISYAVWWIRQSILQAIAEQARIVRLPLNKIGSINKINRTFAKLEQEFEREPTPDEISGILDLTVDEIRDSMRSVGRHVSMDAPLSNDEDSSSMYELMEAIDSPCPDKSLLQESLQHEIERVLTKLQAKEAEIVRLYYGLNGRKQLSLDEIGELFTLSRERVRQIKEKAIKRIKRNARCAHLKSYLG